MSAYYIMFLLIKNVMFSLLVLCLIQVQHITAEWISVKPNGLLGFNYVAGTWISSSTVVVVGNSGTTGTILRSTDQGLTWSAITTTYVPSLYYAVSSQNIGGTTYVIAVDDLGYRYLSTNGGVTWSDLRITSTYGFIGVTIGSNGNAFICGTASTVYKSSTSSSFGTWTRTALSGTSFQVNDVK